MKHSFRLAIAARVVFCAWLALIGITAHAQAEDGYDLWLRYRPLDAAAQRTYRAAASELVTPAQRSPTLEAARQELARGLAGMIGRAPADAPRWSRSGAVLLGTPESTPDIAALNLDLSALGDEGYVIRSVALRGRRATVIAANTDIGALYGAFDFLRLLQTGAPIAALDINAAPRVGLRLLNHWDNLDGTVERGYAGHSIFDWHLLPHWVDPRLIDYARANASVGINGAVITNVNANAIALTRDYIARAAAVADALRPYGVRIYLTARFSAPVEIGGLSTADPLDPAVQAWWRAKAAEIYQAIPDFGGFLVKANSEGQPGPQDYGRTHAEGANLLADALAPHGGIVMWRAFVYSADNVPDRTMQAYDEFAPLDGAFRENVVIQAKNGPLDFQPREPFSPLFGAMRRTPVMMELQITKEYLGLATNLAYLGTLWEEVFDADTFVEGEGSTVGRVIDGRVSPTRITAIAGVSNIGASRNWTGSHFDQANWYAFGRLAWDHELDAEAIAREWAAMTFTPAPGFVEPAVAMMMGSREAVVNYMTPLGLTHVMATGHHYGPGPWVDNLSRPDWNPYYYHRADATHIGFDRTASGSNAISQYSSSLAARFADVSQVGDEYLLWFHRLPWDHRMASGRTLWDELVARYTLGVTQVRDMRATWATLAPMIDAERAHHISSFLAIQEREAQWWRDASIAYFQSKSGRPIPDGFSAPEHPLAHYQGIQSYYPPGWPGVTASPFSNSHAIRAAE